MSHYIVLLTMGLLTSLWGCGQKKVLTDNEIEICTTISYDQSIAEELKKETNSDIILLPEISEYGEVLKTNDEGLCSKIAAEQGFHFVIKNKEHFRSKGYLLFVFEDDNNQKYLATIKGTNEFEILKWRQTNGINHGLENKDVIAKLENWKSKYDFAIVGVAIDWLQFQFTGTRPKFETFAKEVYEFCPDIVDQGTGDMPTLISELKKADGVFLWWD